MPYKILDLQENDTATHEADISAFVSPEVLAILIKPERILGTGNFNVYPRTGTIKCETTKDTPILVPIQDQILKWKNTVANDDWDIYLIAYFAQRRTR